MWEYDVPHVIDAGGYNVMATFVTQSGNLRSQFNSFNVTTEKERNDEPFYPYTIDEYHEWLVEHSDEFEWATVMDYACEERFDKLWDYRERMDATVENTIKHQNLLDDMSPSNRYKILPVLQGREPQEYLEFYDRLVDHGIPIDHLGVGTVCRLSSEKRIVKYENVIRKNTDVERLHGFGVKIQSFSHGAGFDSADSQAWVYNASNGHVVVDDDTRLRSIQHDNSLIRTVESFKNYYKYVTRLQQGKSAIEYETPVDSSMTDDTARETLSNTYSDMISS